MAYSKYQKLQKKYITRISSLFEEQEAAHIIDCFKEGQNKYLRLSRVESSSYDMSWIHQIEGCLYDLGEIVKDPRKVIETVTNLVPVELARKTNGESVQHLASHTQYVKEIKDNGDVIPSKILNIGADDFYATYENKFIATLIRFLIVFVEKRFDYVTKVAPLTNAEVLYFKNKSKVDGLDVDMELKIKVTQPASKENIAQNTEYINRIKEIRKYVRYYYNSDFMKMMKNEGSVRSPILQTNIIRKNPKYRHCYNLYRFIERYDKLGVSYRVNEDYSTFTDEEIKEMNDVILANFLALKGSEAENPKPTKIEHKFAPVILQSIDDEAFIYGPLYEGPISFVRSDEIYRSYLQSTVDNSTLPREPSKAEKEYYAEEYARLEAIAKHNAEINKLIARKEKELKNFTKFLEGLDEKEQKERQAAAKKKREEIEALRAQLVEDVRKQLIQKGKDARVHKVSDDVPLAGEADDLLIKQR